MSAELLARKTERSPTHFEDEFLSEPSEFDSFINYLSQMMPEEERSSYLEGAQLAYIMSKTFTPDLEDLSPETFQTFLTRITHTAREEDGQHAHSLGEKEVFKRFNIDEIIRNRAGLNFLKPGLSKVYDGESVYKFFSKFESPYIKIGARTAIELVDLEVTFRKQPQPEIVSPPVEIFQGEDLRLLSA